MTVLMWVLGPTITVLAVVAARRGWFGVSENDLWWNQAKREPSTSRGRQNLEILGLLSLLVVILLFWKV